MDGKNFEGTVVRYKNLSGDIKTIILIQKIGKGAFGIVFKAMLEGYGLIALKIQELNLVVLNYPFTMYLKRILLLLQK